MGSLFAADVDLIAALLIGLAGSVHCVGMCGGIVAAFSVTLPDNQPRFSYLFLYNLGRILSYGVIGAIAGGIGLAFSNSISAGTTILYFISALMLILLGLYIGNWWKVLRHHERLAQGPWRKIQPVSKAFLPMNHPAKALPFGLIWGWLPCGLVYSTLSWSVAAGSAAKGAMIMIFFGLGTLPALITLGMSALNIRQILSKSLVQKAIGSLMIIYGLLMILKSVH